MLLKVLLVSKRSAMSTEEQYEHSYEAVHQLQSKAMFATEEDETLKNR